MALAVAALVMESDLVTRQPNTARDGVGLVPGLRRRMWWIAVSDQYGAQALLSGCDGRGVWMCEHVLYFPACGRLSKALSMFLLLNISHGIGCCAARRRGLWIERALQCMNGVLVAHRNTPSHFLELRRV
jgi:hypothetical protein